MSKGVLEGIKVLDFTAALSGPYLAWQLADWGADVWKIERNGSGDQSRYWDPILNDISIMYATYNKNKASIEMDLSASESKEVIYEMVKHVDVVIENFKAGSMERLGFGYEKLKEINPKIVFASISGFGATGPLMKYPAYDAIAAARGGFAACNGEPDAPPVKSGNANGDTFTASHTLCAIMMALVDAKNTGLGCHIDIAMTDTVMVSCAETIMDYAREGKAQPRFGNHDRFIAPYGIFEARDGWAVIIADTQEKWLKLCDTLGLDTIKSDSRFKDNAARIENKKALVEEMEKVTKTFKRGEIEKKLLDAGVPAAEVLPFIEAYTSQHAKANDLTSFANQAKIGLMRFYNNPIRFNDQLCPIHRASPLLGEDTRDILKNVGYSEEEIDRLYEIGAVGSTLI